MAWVTVGAWAAVLAAGAEAAPAGSRVSLVATSGSKAAGVVCGARRRVLSAPANSVITARVGVRRARRKGRRVTVKIERCSQGRWRFLRRVRVRDRRRRPLRFQSRLPGLRVGEYRLTSRVRVAASPRRRRARARHAYLRITEPIVDVPVRFRVKNVNRSAVACSSDGSGYTIAGRLVSPRSQLRRRSPGVTLYLHEFSWGRFFWNFPAQGYDYATELARAGHASVVIDRLGYDLSSRPPGTATCQGAQADIANQVVDQLRAGGYSAAGVDPARFRRVGVAGHSVGGGIAELQAYSFRNLDALMLFAYADQGFTPAANGAAAQQGLKCGAGGEPSDPGGPPGYAHFNPTPEAFKEFSFKTAPASVADRAAAMRNRDPCGDVNSTVATIATNTRRLGEVEVPVLLLYGTEDAVYDQPSAGESQRRMFTGSGDVSLEFFSGAGHALTLERQAPQLRATVQRWLAKRGL